MRRLNGTGDSGRAWTTFMLGSCAPQPHDAAHGQEDSERHDLMPVTLLWGQGYSGRN